MNTFIGQGRTQDIPAQHLAALLVIGRRAAGGVQIEAAELGTQVTLGFVACVDCEWHKERFTLVRGTSGRRARSRSREQGPVQGIGFSKSVFQDGIHFIIAGCGGEGDKATSFQLAQDALTRSLNDKVDIGLGGLGRGVEDETQRCCAIGNTALLHGFIDTI